MLKKHKLNKKLKQANRDSDSLSKSLKKLIHVNHSTA